MVSFDIIKFSIAIHFSFFSACPAVFCTRESNPQCGSDRTTYRNPCELRKAKCDNPELYLAYPGECLGKYDVFPQGSILGPIW